MEYRVLGTLEVIRDDKSVDLGSFRPRALLALLLTQPNSVFSTDQIIDGLWGDEAGADKQNSLWVFVSGLRKALEPEREKRTDGTLLLTRSPGYLVSVEADEVDSIRFEKLVAEGRALADTDPAAASLVLGEALALWRGRPFEDFTYESAFQAEIARLSELRVEAVEARIDADLKRGMARELVSELESLSREHPLRERITGQLMMALYRSGRQAEALRAYQLLKSRLGEELGIDPSGAVRRLEEQIVTADPALDSPRATARAGSETEPGLAVRGYELREKIGEGAFGVAYRAYQPAVGREVAIKVIRPELADDPAFIRRFEAEAQLVARLEHPHIVPLYDYWREPGAAYLVMRLMKGGSLADVLETSALSGRQAALVAEQMAGALHAAHSQSVVHRDVKPSNILIDGEGNAYLSDFGIAVGADGGMSQDPSVSGTLAAPYASPEQLAQGEVSPASDLFSLSVVLAQALTGLHGDVEQIRGALTLEVASVIDKATDSVRSRRYQDARAFLDDFRVSLGEEAESDDPTAPLAEVDNPYKGLRSFNEADTSDFFGRERLVDRLMYRLSEPGERGRFIALVGPSGSGKSSVVKAGLLPALSGGALALSENWFTVQMVPAPHPFEELESALLSVAVNPPSSILEQLTAGPNGLVRAINGVLPEDGSQLLLIIDQFEELFTQVDAGTAERFLEALVAAVTDSHSRIRVLLTLRADFYDRPLRHQTFGELVRDGTEAITPMTPVELERAITGPLEGTGVAFDPALVAAVVRDVVGRPSALPLMQYTLTELYEGRTTARIAAAAYEDLGGVSGALIKRAEGLISGLSPDGRDAARQIFLRLVTLGEGADDTRRRVLLSELEGLPAPRSELNAVLDTFGRHRLVSFDRDPITRGPTVEIAHETMLTEWTRLRDWVDGARDDVRNQRRLAQAMSEWVGADRDDAYLLRGGRLDQLHGWATTASISLSGPENEFLASSLEERGRVEVEERLRLEQAADAERRARQRSRQLALVAGFSALLVVVAVFAAFQWSAARSAEATVEESRRALELVSASNSALNEDPQLALMTAIEAVRVSSDSGFVLPDALDALHWAIQRNQIAYPADEETPIAVRSGPLGVTGVYALSPDAVVALAQSGLSDTFSATDCAKLFVDEECPDPAAPIPDGLEIFGGADAYGVVPQATASLAGTSVEFAEGWTESDIGLRDEFLAFEEETGIKIDHHRAVGIDEDMARRLSERIALPDLATWPQPAAIASWESNNTLVDLGTYLDETTLESDFGDYLLGLGTVGSNGEWPADEGTLFGLPIDIDLKGLVFYPKAPFEAAGYQVPDTLDELVQLSAQLVADGEAPWCFAFESGLGSGWPGTDLIESLLLRLGGVDAYDDWSYHRTRFDSSEASEAGRYLEGLVFEPGFVRGGPGLISRTNFHEPLFSLLERDPETNEVDPTCWFLHQGDFMFGQMPIGTQVGVDVDFFPLPPAVSGGITPAIGGGNYIGVINDRPEVRMFVEFLASPRYGEYRANGQGSNFLSANARFDVSNYAGSEVDPEGSVRTAVGVTVRDAVAAGVFRFDASDLMPPTIGAVTPDLERGAFWQGMLDFTDGVKPIEQVLSDIEAEWVALEAKEGT